MLSDTVRLEAGPLPKTIEFFQEPPGPISDPVTDVREQEIVRLVMDEFPYRSLILSHLHRQPDARYLCEVDEPFFRKGTGDIDVLLWDQNSPQCAFAIEFKRMKVRAGEEERQRCNRLAEIAEGVRQANALLERGFYQVGLGLIIVTDASAQTQYNTFARGARKPVFDDIRARIALGRLHRDVGVIVIEVVQPSAKSFRDFRSFKTHVERPAVPQTQPDPLTRQVEWLSATAHPALETRR